MSNETSDKTIFQTVLHLLGNIGTQGISYELSIQLLAILCLLCIVNRPPPSQVLQTVNPPPIPPANALQKMVSDVLDRVQ